MNAGALKDLFRAHVGDAAAPYLWSDTEVFDYIDDAQNMFCRLTDGISDATTTAVVDIDVEADDEWLDSHASILRIRAATRTSDGMPLNILNFEDLDRLGVRLDGTTGDLTGLIIGMEENKIRLLRKAIGADTIRLLVFRLPLITIDGSADELEIPTIHHTHLMDWIEHRAYSKPDSETLDQKRADTKQATFRAYCEQVQEEQRRKRHKTRVVGYGGIAMSSGTRNPDTRPW